MIRHKPTSPTMPGVEEPSYEERKAVSERGRLAHRRSNSPFVQAVREAYVQSPAAKIGLKQQ